MSDDIVKNFLESLGVVKNLKNITQRILPIIPSADRERISSMLEKCGDDIYQAYIKTYGELFTEDELKELTAINNIPVMQKFKDKQEEALVRIDHYAKLVIMKYIAEQTLREPVPNIPMPDPNKDLN